MDRFLATGEAVLPIFGLIVLGAVLRRLPLMDAKGWAGVDRIVYWVFFPALLFAAVARADLNSQLIAPMALGLAAVVVIMTFLLFILARVMDAPRAARSSLVMGGIRFNTFLGVAIAEQMFGALGVTLSAICIVVLVPMVNLISIWTLQRGTPGGGIFRTLGSLMRNPLLIACVAGLLVNLSGTEPYPVLMTGVDLLSQAALPLGLVAVGASLAFDTPRKDQDLLAAGVVAKMLVLPALAFGIFHLLDPGPAAMVVAVMWFALPAAPSSYDMARTLGGDAPLMAGLLTAQLVAAVITLPILLGLLI